MSIQKLRDRSDGLVAKIIVGAIIVVFALFGMGSITTFLAPIPKVATVDGEDITQAEMELAVERSRRIMISQGANPSDIDEDELRKSVLDNLVSRKLLTIATDDLDLFYSESLLDAEIVQTPAFQVDGNFNASQFQIVLQGAGFTPVTYRREVQKDKKIEQLAIGIRSTAFMTDEQAARSNSLAQQTRDVAFLRIEVAKLAESVEITPEDIQTYYDDHKLDYQTEESVNLSYVELRRSALEAAVNVTDDALMTYFAETKDQYAEDENRRIAHILIEVNDEQTDTEALTKINDLYDQLIAGADFAALAKANSNDPGSADKGGDLGFNEPGTFVPEFEKVAYDLGLNELSAPLRTEFGYHLIKIIDIEPAKEPVFAEVKAKVEAAYRESEAEREFVSISARMSEMAFESSDLIDLSEELGLEIQTTGDVSRDASEGIMSNLAVADAAFSADVLLDGNNSQLIEIDPNHHVVFRVKEHKPAEVRPLEQVASGIEEQLKQQEARKIAEARAEELLTMLKTGSVAGFVADQYELKWEVVGQAKRNQAGLDREINRAAFSLPRPADGNKSVGTTVLTNGDAIVISVTNVKNKEIDESDTPFSLAAVLSSQQGNVDFSEWRQTLEAEAKITR